MARTAGEPIGSVEKKTIKNKECENIGNETHGPMQGVSINKNAVKTSTFEESIEIILKSENASFGEVATDRVDKTSTKSGCAAEENACADISKDEDTTHETEDVPVFDNDLDSESCNEKTNADDGRVEMIKEVPVSDFNNANDKDLKINLAKTDEELSVTKHSVKDNTKVEIQLKTNSTASETQSERDSSVTSSDVKSDKQKTVSRTTIPLVSFIHFT